MLFTQWLNDLTDRVLRKRTAKFARKARRPSRKGVPQPSELLESRIVPATIDVTLAAGALTIAGDGDANDIEISVSGDTYTLQAGATDVFNVVADDTATATGDGTATVTIGAAAAHVTTITVNLNGGDDTLTLTSVNADDTVSASGGDGNDTFNINGAITADTLSGDGDDDTFNVNAVLTGAIDGGDGNDVLQGSVLDDVSLSAAGGTDGFDGDETDITGGFDNINEIVGNGALATLNGEDAGAATWTLSGTSGTYTDGTNTVDFSGFALLQGRGAADTFNTTTTSTFELSGGDGDDIFDIDGKLNGSIDGQGGSDTLQGNVINNVTLTATGGTDGFAGTETDVTGGFDNIDVAIGNSGTLTGINAPATWDVGGANTYTSTNTLTFGGFGTLRGGTDTDEFTISGTPNVNLKGGSGTGDDTFILNGTLTGSIDGEGQTTGDVLSGTSVDNVTLTSSGANGFAGNENSLTGGFAGIDRIEGNGGTLTGISVASTWNLDGTPTYETATATLEILGFTTLQGGSAVDTFNVTANSTFDLDGGAGNDVINIDAELTGTANGGAGNDTLDARDSTLGATLFGGDGNDVLIGTEQDDILDGGAGADRLFGLGGDDQLTGGTGNDSLVGGDGTDTVVEVGVSSATITNTRITGGLGTDSLSGVEQVDLTGNSGNNLLDASAFTLGAVTLDGGEGSDTIAGSASFGDVLDGGVDVDGTPDTDVLRANVSGTVTVDDAGLTSNGVTDAISNFESVSLTGGSGDDVIDASGFSGSATINGGAGNDSITGAAGASLLNGMSGNDTITGQAENDSISGGAGNDDLNGGAGNDDLNGGDGDDTIAGDLGNDTITGDGGKDSIDGGDGDDKIDAGAGNDTVIGGLGDDSILGGSGQDSIEGNEGNDTLNGNADADRIEGGDGNDVIFGGAGSDVLLGGNGDDQINSQGGNDTLLGEDGNDTLNGGAGNELMFGGDGDDSMNGQAGNDTLLGDDGDDTLLGGAGNDLCLGGLGGDDYINGQSGKDTVGGGGDQDVIIDPAKERIDNATHDDFYSNFDSTLFVD
jgi:Ca2+-binding RTX toxin-like protein